MCIYICVCIYILYVCIYIYIYVYIVYICMYVCIYMYVYTYVCMYIYCICIDVCMYICICMYMYICIYILYISSYERISAPKSSLQVPPPRKSRRACTRGCDRARGCIGVYMNIYEHIDTSPYYI